jgi:protein-S-isoprenylcysteine O-methyltransferase Ste14
MGLNGSSSCPALEVVCNLRAVLSLRTPNRLPKKLNRKQYETMSLSTIHTIPSSLERSPCTRWVHTTPTDFDDSILIALPVLFHYLIPIIILVPKPYSYLGALVMLLGLGLMTWAAMLFRKVETSFQLQGKSSSLVTSGPFHLSRNPIYLGMLIWLIGLAILLGSLIAFVFPPVFFMLANFYVIPLEEKSMEQMFGKQFVEYKRRARRWL